MKKEEAVEALKEIKKQVRGNTHAEQGIERIIASLETLDHLDGVVSAKLLISGYELMLLALNEVEVS